jgi:hypothetical protein
MLDAIALLARRIQPAAPVFAGTAVLLFIAAAGLILLDSTGRADPWLTLIIVLLLWSVCGWVFIRVFATIPAPPAADQQGIALLLAWLNRAFHLMLALVFAGATVAAVLLTSRLAGEWGG